MFQGVSALSLDAKGRLLVPARYREHFVASDAEMMTLTKHPEGCLLLFPQNAWEVFREKIAQLPMDAHWWRRIFLGNASDQIIDKAGRVLIVPELRVAAGLERDVMLLGMGSHFEIWNADTYLAKEQTVMAQGLPEALKQLTF